MADMLKFINNRARRAIEQFVQLESAGGKLLMFATALALLVANGPWSAAYQAILHIKWGVTLPIIDMHYSILHWINDGLMALFFLLVALEMKREFYEGHFAERRNILLPLIAAAGGMVMPALIFLAINRSSPATLQGWAVPTATDIAFALGVLSLLGSRAPLGLKIVLTAIAILDDLGAVIIIALFYGNTPHYELLGLALLVLGAMALLNRLKVTRLMPYIVLALLLWLLVLKSGIHATLAGVAAGLMIPMRGKGAQSPLKHLEHWLHPWVVYGVLPLFAFANAGLVLKGLRVADLWQPLPLGIALALLLGKTLGIALSLWFAVKSRLVALPSDVGFAHVIGLALLCGIGFTMSLFIGSLAFVDVAQMNLVRLGVLAGSLTSAVFGLLWLGLQKP
jgi:Na+:H+ antiporter, NhaA family